MFYYISFLRPPPSSSPPGSVSFTPQIANDLRTELFPGAQDIFYAWLPSTESLEDTQVQPRKLMTWSQAVAYKEISIALPPIARPGQSWRLILSASPSTKHMFIPLGNVHSTGKAPFPVISIPIKITPKPDKILVKQTQVERMYCASLAGLGDLHFLLREQTSFDLDKVIDLCLCSDRWVC
jgi:protein N-lysine methyltransferase METTL21D